MADVTIHLNRISSVEVAPYLDKAEPFTVVRLNEEYDDTRIHVTPRTLARGREVAAALVAACDIVEGASRAVPIASLAPDPVSEADKAPTVLEDDDLEQRRRLGAAPAYDWDPAA